LWHDRTPMKTTKLKLRRDTVRSLSVLQLGAVVAAGGTPDTGRIECPLANNIVLATATPGCQAG
jgi:hypothetical protein